MKTGFTISVLFFVQSLLAQTDPVHQWIQDLKKRDDSQSLRLPKLITAIKKYDSAGQRQIISEMEKQVMTGSGDFLKARFYLLKGFALQEFLSRQGDYPLMNELQQSLSIANELKDDILLADVCYFYAGIMNDRRQVEQAIFYNLKSVELVEKKGLPYFFGVSHRYNILGELLYHTREYEKSIEYSKKAIYNKADPAIFPWKIFNYNTIGLAYKKLGQYDSAIAWYDSTAQIAAEMNSDIWVAIAGGNKAQIYFEQKKYEAAKPLFENDYLSSIKNKEWDNAANNLQWLARIDLKAGKKDSALQKARAALALLGQRPQTNYFINTYQTLTEIFTELNRKDSSSNYSQLYTHLHDSVERAVAISQSEIIKLRLNEENNRHKITMLEKEKQTERIKRNAFIAIVLLMGAIAYLYYNRQRSRHRQQQKLKELELQSAAEKMNLFTKTIAEKTELIEQLQLQLEEHAANPLLQQNLESLKQKTILTEVDWNTFQQLFEKIYPGFFARLRIKSGDITNAELRFAAIIRLQMNNRQAGAMLGISADSARKTRLRLRQRLNLSEEASLEQFILTL